MKFYHILFIFSLTFIVQGATPFERHLEYQEIKEDYEDDELDLMKQLIQRKAPAMNDYLSLLSKEDSDISEFNDNNLYEFTEICDIYIYLESEKEKMMVEAYVQALAQTWILASKYQKKPSKALEKKIKQITETLAEKKIHYQLLELQQEKQSLEDRLVEVKEGILELSQQNIAVKSEELYAYFTNISKPNWWKNQPAPEITFNDLQSNLVFTLSSLKGQVVYIDFWASWCGPCQKPMNHLNDLAKKRNKDWQGKVQLIGLSVDDEPQITLNHLRKKNWIACRQTWAANGFESVAAKAYHVDGIPTAFLVDASGNIVWAGYPEDLNLEAKIEALLKQKIN